MALVRMIGDRILEKRGAPWQALPVPDGPPGSMPSAMPIPVQHGRRTAVALPPAAPAITEARQVLEGDERPRLVIENTPVGRITIHPADHSRRLAVYESAAREVHRLPVVRVWEIVHSSRLRAAIVLEAKDPPAYTIYLNSLRTQCAVHRISSFRHEIEHGRQGDCLKAEGYNEAMERRCEAVGEVEALGAARLAVERESSASINAERCQRCSVNSEAPCPQGPDVFVAVQRALAPL